MVSNRDDADWVRLCEVAGRPEFADHPILGTAAGRLENRAAAVGVLTQWLFRRERSEALAALQAAGIPAGPMMRGPEELTDPQLTVRGAFADLEHPQLPMTLATNRQAATYSTIPEPPLRLAPSRDEHTREICTSLAKLTDTEIDKLLVDGVLEIPS